jgi:hypothetical protein
MLLIGVAGTELTAQERDWLQHDAVAGWCCSSATSPRASR